MWFAYGLFLFSVPNHNNCIINSRFSLFIPTIKTTICPMSIIQWFHINQNVANLICVHVKRCSPFRYGLFYPWFVIERALFFNGIFWFYAKWTLIAVIYFDKIGAGCLIPSNRNEITNCNRNPIKKNSRVHANTK